MRRQRQIAGGGYSIRSRGRNGNVNWWITPQDKLDGVDPLLFADFKNSRYMLNNVQVTPSQIFTVTSAAGKTYVDYDGIMKFADANTLRIDYSYGVGEMMDYGSYTQEIWPSRAKLGFWHRNGSAYDPSQTMIGIRGDSIEKIVPTTATGLKFTRPCNNTISYVTGTTYTFSFDIFIPPSDVVSDIILETPNSTAFSFAAWGTTLQNTINVKNGVYSGGFSGVSIRRIGPMYRVTKTVTATGTAVGNGFPAIYWGVYAPNTGDGVSGYFIDRSNVTASSAELPYVEASTANVAVGADTIQLTAAAFNILNGANGAVAARGVYPVAAIASSRLIAYGLNHIVGPRTSNNVQAESYNGTTPIYATAGSGGWSTGFGAVGSWSASARSICLNGGTVTNDPNGRGTAAAITVGPPAGMQAGQAIRLRQLVGWNLPAIGTNAQLQAQARTA